MDATIAKPTPPPQTISENIRKVN
jgi:hypothetical protein